MTQRYLKLFNENKTNRGLTYPTTGTVTDSCSLNTTCSSCVSGLYFSKPEEILKFLTNHTISIQEVTPTSGYILDYLSKDKYRTKTINLYGIEKSLSDVSTWEWMKSEFNMDFTAHNNSSIQYACIMGYIDVINYLLSQGCDYTVQNYYCLYQAVLNNKIETLYHIVNTLNLQISMDVINETFVRLCVLGNTQNLNTFYQTITIKPDITYDNYKAFRMACISGNMTMVMSLIVDYYGLNNINPWIANNASTVKMTAFTENWDVLYISTDINYYNPVVPVSIYKTLLYSYAKEQGNEDAMNWCLSL